jgi:hypothetical protein
VVVGAAPVVVGVSVVVGVGVVVVVATGVVAVVVAATGAVVVAVGAGVGKLKHSHTLVSGYCVCLVV